MGEIVLNEKVYDELITAAKALVTHLTQPEQVRLNTAIEAAEKDKMDGSDYLSDNRETSDREPLRHED